MHLHHHKVAEPDEVEARQDEVSRLERHRDDLRQEIDELVRTLEWLRSEVSEVMHASDAADAAASTEEDTMAFRTGSGVEDIDHDEQSALAFERFFHAHPDHDKSREWFLSDFDGVSA